MATPPSEGADKLDGSAKELRELNALRGELRDSVQAQREGAEQAQAASRDATGHAIDFASLIPSA